MCTLRTGKVPLLALQSTDLHSCQQCREAALPPALTDNLKVSVFDVSFLWWKRHLTVSVCSSLFSQDTVPGSLARTPPVS